MDNESKINILVIEPFCSGSHKQLVDFLRKNFFCEFITLPGKKWHWRARTSALYFSQEIPFIHNYQVLFASSNLNLAELIALRSDLLKTKKIIYFHENQLVYPVQQTKENDYQYGYNQIISCLVADKVCFNSEYNLTSFLENIQIFLNKIPNFKPKNIREQIQEKSMVLYFPVCLSKCDTILINKQDPIHILWPHRWEYDKNPILFFKSLYKLKNEGLLFKLSILGQQFNKVPEIFNEAKIILQENIVNFGFQEKSDYFRVLSSCDVVVSTANHEFFGVAMIEAVHFGCQPIAPKKLSYIEIFPDKCLYRTDIQLFNMLKNSCLYPSRIRKMEKKKMSNEIKTLRHNDNSSSFSKQPNQLILPLTSAKTVAVKVFVTDNKPYFDAKPTNEFFKDKSGKPSKIWTWKPIKQVLSLIFAISLTTFICIMSVWKLLK